MSRVLSVEVLLFRRNLLKHILLVLKLTGIQIGALNKCKCERGGVSEKKKYIYIYSNRK